MSGLNVEALLDSVAPSKEAQGTAEREDRHKQDRSERRDRDRARDGSRDRERDRKRRDRSRDRKRDGIRDKDRERERDKDKDKEYKDDDEEHVKSPRSERASKGGSRRHSGERRRDKRRTSDEGDDRHGSGSGDFYRGGRRSRTASPDGGDRYYRPSAGRGGHREEEGGRDCERERERDRPRERERERDRDRERDRERDRGRRGGGRASRPRSHSRGKSRTKSPPLNEDERDRRTVFVQQLAARLRSKELIAFFEKVGPVKEAQIVKDRVSGRSKGVGYVEFKNEESVPLAIQLTGQKLLGIPIIAQLTEAEKNRQARNNEGAQGTNGIPFHRLYVGNIHFSITESDLQNVFEPFGELEFVQLQKEEGGRSRGYGFVQFRDPTAAKEALEKMNGFDLAGRPIRVGLGNDKFTSETTANLLQRFPGPGQPGFQGSDFSGLGGRGTHAGGANNFDRAGGRDEKGASGASALDDTDVAGVNFSNYSRDALMRKLARTDEPAEANGPSTDRRPMAKPKTETKPLPVNVPQASRCVVLRNMFNANEEEGDEWIKELEDDVKAECEEKYGHVVHIALDPNSNGDIYVKFDRVTGGENAIRGLNGRFFGGRQISAQPVVDAVYSSLFTRSRAM